MPDAARFVRRPDCRVLGEAEIRDMDNDAIGNASISTRDVGTQARYFM